MSSNSVVRESILNSREILKELMSRMKTLEGLLSQESYMLLLEKSEQGREFATSIFHLLANLSSNLDKVETSPVCFGNKDNQLIRQIAKACEGNSLLLSQILSDFCFYTEEQKRMISEKLKAGMSIKLSLP